MIEPTVYFQLGISEERYSAISKEISSILKTNEKIGIMLVMAKDSKTMNSDEKMYAAFMIAKSDIQSKMMKGIPAIGRGMVAKLLEE